MLLLTSVNDRLQVVTSSAATIDVHASWVDTSAGAITPGRTNTALVGAAAYSVAGTVAASTQRNVKTLHIRNKHATLTCDIIVQHTDGTVVSQLYKTVLSPGDMMEYTDQAGFGGGRVAATPAPAPPPPSTFPTQQVFRSGSGTYLKPADALYIEVLLVGGGGGGGGGSAGGNTTFGPMTAFGGGQGGPGAPGGAGGAASGGTINLQGGGGMAGNVSLAGTFGGTGGNGGASFLGGAGASVYNGAGRAAAVNTGGGGAGGGCDSSTTLGTGSGGGSGGYCSSIITAPAATYAYAVGAGGTAQPPNAGTLAGGAGGSGIIIIKEFYR